MRLFSILGEKIYCLIKGIKKEYFLKKQSAVDIRNLYPGKNADEKLKEYYIHKFAFIFCIFFIGILLAVFTLVQNNLEHVIQEGEYIVRNSYGGGEKQIHAAVGYEDGSREEILFSVGERHYTERELEKLYEQAKEEVYGYVFAGGIKADAVRENLCLPDSLEGFPFSIQWESESYALVDYDGTVYNKTLQKEGEVVNLVAIFQCDEFRREYTFPVHILPPLFSDEEIRHQELLNSIEDHEKKSIYEKNCTLPDQVGGQTVCWKEVKENSAGSVLLLAFAASMIIYYLKDYDLHKQVLLKREEMLETYPEIVNRLVLYVGAGMTVRNAWRKIASDYTAKRGRNRKKGYIYQEMLFTCYEIDNGTSEGEAYERFGKRCGMEQYIKLATLLVQNMQKGNSTMLRQLKEEAEIAFTQRINNARKKGEEAGTKLLMPMMILFGMVMVLIMIPAFGTFGA